MPTSRQVGEQTVWRVFSQLVSYASSDQLLVWVSDRTQEKNTGIPRRSVRSARVLLLESGLMLDTGTVKQKGVKVYQMKIPGYEFAPTLPTEPFNSGLASGLASGRASGRASGLASGLASGSADLPQTELEKNKYKKEHNENTNENNLTQAELDNAGEYQMIDKTTAEQYADEETRQRAHEASEKLERERADAQKFAMEQVYKMLGKKFEDDNEEPF